MKKRQVTEGRRSEAEARREEKMRPSGPSSSRGRRKQVKIESRIPSLCDEVWEENGRKTTVISADCLAMPGLQNASALRVAQIYVHSVLHRQIPGCNSWGLFRHWNVTLMDTRDADRIVHSLLGVCWRKFQGQKGLKRASAAKKIGPVLEAI